MSNNMKQAFIQLQQNPSLRSRFMKGEASMALAMPLNEFEVKALKHAFQGNSTGAGTETYWV